ncbi:MAG TPA: TlpA disulfide reductase family protein, partial [Cyclobacteriaceae bacterium]|nr:TlpA disulfide reductase family protein [Cyclobacteriaceae bacterium]
FTIQDLQGNKIPFEQFQGKVIFLNLWATWCGPCRAEMAGIERLYSKIDKSSIAFVMLSLDRDSDKNKVISYMQSKGFTFPGFMPSGYLPAQLKVPEIPTTFIISKEGKIVRKEVGSMRYDTPKFQKFLEGLSQ